MKQIFKMVIALGVYDMIVKPGLSGALNSIGEKASEVAKKHKDGKYHTVYKEPGDKNPFEEDRIGFKCY